MLQGEVSLLGWRVFSAGSAIQGFPFSACCSGIPNALLIRNTCRYCPHRTDFGQPCIFAGSQFPDVTRYAKSISAVILGREEKLDIKTKDRSMVRGISQPTRMYSAQAFYLYRNFIAVLGLNSAIVYL